MTQDPINVKIWFSEINPNDPVESEIRRIKPKERAERLRTLATIAIILRPFSELIAKSVKRTPDGYIDSRSDNKNEALRHIMWI